MSIENNTFEKNNGLRDRLSEVASSRVVKVIGGTLLGGVVGYSASRGIDLVIPVEPLEVYSGVVTMVGMGMGGALTAEVTL